jgi:hypothetical protein
MVWGERVTVVAVVVSITVLCGEVLRVKGSISAYSQYAGDPCTVRTGNPDIVPCLRVPHCEDGTAQIKGFYLSVPDGLVSPPLPPFPTPKRTRV